MKKTIWQNYDLRIEDYDGCREDWDEMSEEEKYEYIVDLNNMFLDDERANLNIQLNNPILVIASMGLWNGRKTGYKIISSGNIKDILCADGDYAEWWIEGRKVLGRYTHHDGANYMEYREITDIDKLENTVLPKIYNNEDYDRKELYKCTRSIAKQIKSVYGW